MTTAGDRTTDAVSTARRLLEILERKDLLAAEDPLELTQALGIGIRAAHLLGFHQLSRVAGGFPSSVQALLEAPEPDVDVDRDARVQPGDYLGFVDLIDILSEEDLPCVAPGLHRGWQDKAQSCREARRAALRGTGFSIGELNRDPLLAAAANYNRAFWAPGPLWLEPNELRKAIRSLLHLVNKLAPVDGAGDQIRKVTSRLRSKLSSQ